MLPNRRRRNADVLCEGTAGLKRIFVQFLDNGTIDIIEAWPPDPW
jgi:hypothetical protein